MSNLFGQEVSIGGRLGKRRKSSIGEPENRNRMRQAPAVLAQEPFHFLLLIRSQPVRQVNGVDNQNDCNRRIGFGRVPIECLKGKNLVRLAVVQQGEVPALSSGPWAPR